MNVKRFVTGESDIQTCINAMFGESVVEKLKEMKTPRVNNDDKSKVKAEPVILPLIQVPNLLEPTLFVLLSDWAKTKRPKVPRSYEDTINSLATIAFVLQAVVSAAIKGEPVIAGEFQYKPEDFQFPFDLSPLDGLGRVRLVEAGRRSEDLRDVIKVPTSLVVGPEGLRDAIDVVISNAKDKTVNAEWFSVNTTALHAVKRFNSVGSAYIDVKGRIFGDATTSEDGSWIRKLVPLNVDLSIFGTSSLTYEDWVYYLK